MNESPWLGLYPDKKLKLDEQNSIVLNSTSTSPKTIIELPNKSYVDRSHKNSTNRRNLKSVFSDPDKRFDDNKLTNLDSFTVIRYLRSDNELSIKKYIDDEVIKNGFLRFNQTLQKYLKVFVQNHTFNFTKYDKIQITNTTKIKHPK